VRGLDARTIELPASALQPVRRARAGEWLWTTRPGSERDLCEELALWRADSRPQLVAPALVASHGAPLASEGAPRLAFARQGFPLSAVLDAADSAALLAPLAAALAPALERACTKREPASDEREPASDQLERTREEAHGYGLHVWVPDADSSNPLAARASALRGELAARLARELGQPPREQLPAHLPQDVPLEQVCLAGEQLAYAGLLPLGRALSLAPGGRERMRVQADRPSRSARKLEEALAWAGIAPGRGETCIDLGAAPGGWTWIARRRGARVIAIDPAALRPDVAADAGVRHVRASAFGFDPEQPVDWLLCDMAWRPLEVAALLARYARRRDARFLIANFKLPMKRKAEMVARLCEILQSAGWQAVRCRQLYHDRDEVTVFART
jgi:23S rRNA (cytidine2498-2'-O)-methyltransferase